jgi:hypothetical protein
MPKEKGNVSAAILTIFAVTNNVSRGLIYVPDFLGSISAPTRGLSVH